MSKGSLIVVGTGLKGRAQMTEESKAHIISADVVFYMVSDYVAAQWVMQNAKDARDLYIRYANDKLRLDTYTQMRLEIIAEVKKGKRVVAIFYGHPGVFVHPSHRSIAEARHHGFRAEMLPGISAEDCLFADVGVDPAYPGYQTFEASDVLLCNRQIQPELHVVIWQVGCVGLMGFTFQNYDNKNFQMLVDYLLRFYPADHPVTIYEAATFPTQLPRLDVVQVKDLKAEQVSGISTFYIPPYKKQEASLEVLGRFLEVDPKELEGKRLIAADETPSEEKKAELLALVGTNLAKQSPYPKSTALGQYLLKLAFDPVAEAEHIANPEAAVSKHSKGLHPAERAAIVANNWPAVRDALRNPVFAIDFPPHPAPPPREGKKGSLIVAGSGIKGPGQFTAEAVSYVRNADMVFFLANDPLTEQFIYQNSVVAHDLFLWLQDPRPRSELYELMRYDILEEVKRGKDVVAVFYGHPGVFVNPGHKAVAEARKLGYYAEMLPAVSSTDCMFCDLLFDPALPGTQTFDATDLLLHQRAISTDSHVLLLQVGSAGELVPREGARNRHLAFLRDYLLKFYPAEHNVNHYAGAQYPAQAPYVATFPLKDLAEQPVTSISTFDIPPATERGQDAAVYAIWAGEPLEEVVARANKVQTPEQAQSAKEDAEKRSKRILDELETRDPPPGYKIVPRRTHLGTYLISLSEDIVKARDHRADPAAAIEHSGLAFADVEREVLLKADFWKVREILTDRSLNVDK